MSDVEVRRIQRVGSSSLVVTLPKEWARRLGLQPGSRVMLLDEGDSIRVVPVDKGAGDPVEIDLSRMPIHLARGAPLCVYLSGIVEAEIQLPPGQGAVSEVRARSLDLMGLQVYETGPDRVRVEVLLDQSRIDLSRLIRALASVARRAARLVWRAASGGDVSAQVELVRRDFLRTHYVVLRYLTARTTGPSGVKAYHAALAASYAGFTVDLLLETALLASRLHRGATQATRVRPVAGAVEEAVDLLFRVLASPSARRLAELHALIARARAAAEEAMNCDSPVEAVVAAKLHDALRLLMIASYVATCRVIIEAQRPPGQ